MNFITINKTSNNIIVDFGDYIGSNDVDYRKASYDASDIAEINLMANDSYVTVKMKYSHSGKVWALTYDKTYSGSDYFIIDTIDGVEPTSMEDLFNKLTNLRG